MTGADQLRLQRLHVGWQLYTSNNPTGIQSTLRTIDADGTNRYFDLQGRMLNEKPEKGLYIENGKKVINR